MPEQIAFNRYRPHRRGDLATIWKSLRPEDAREFATVGMTDPTLIEDIVLFGGGRFLTWETEVGPVAILGVSHSAEPDVGIVWAVASTAAVPRWRWAVRNTEGALKRLSKGKRLLTNYKDARNVQQINWLAKIGFVFFRLEENYAGSGQAFLQFARIVK